VYLKNQSLAQILKLGTELNWHDPIQLHVDIIFGGLKQTPLEIAHRNFLVKIDMRISHEYLGP
jgi:accessory colonization factor AcfC